MLKVAFLLTLATFAISMSVASEYEDSNRLYRSIAIGDYEIAIPLSKTYRYNSQFINDVIKKLIDNSERNILDYAYSLWNADAQDIVKNYFPIEIRSVVGQHHVKIVGKRDNMVLKLGVKLDGMGDRTAYGDSNHMIGDRMAWKFVPVFDSRLYFYIHNPYNNQYLKMGVYKDSDGDHQVYGDSRNDSYRHQFFLVPVKNDGELFFYIYDREYQQPLKYGRAVDSYGDRLVYGEQGYVVGHPELFGWLIQPY